MEKYGFLILIYKNMKRYFEYKIGDEIIRINNRYYYDYDLCLYFAARSIVIFDLNMKIKSIGKNEKRKNI